MKLISVIFSIAAAFVYSQPTLAGPPTDMGTADYKSYFYFADEPFEVIISTGTDLCREVNLEGYFTQLPAAKPMGPIITQTWVAEFYAFPVFDACRIESPRKVQAKIPLKITPAKGQEHFQFIVPANFSLEFK